MNRCNESRLQARSPRPGLDRNQRLSEALLRQAIANGADLHARGALGHTVLARHASPVRVIVSSSTPAPKYRYHLFSSPQHAAAKQVFGLDMMFPCMRASSRISFIDDDPSFLDAMADAVASIRRCEFLHHPKDLDAAYEGQDDLLRMEQQMLARVNTPGESSIRAGLDYFSWEGRHEIFSVLVSDHVMPAENGISICARHDHFGLRRVLLTGAADTDLAVQAFNQGSIEHFLPKQTQNLGFTLRNKLHEHFIHNSTARGRVLAMQMDKRRLSILQTPEVSHELMVILGRSRVDEYIVLSEPFGVLGLRNDGRLIWIQIESRETLSELWLTLGEFGWDPVGVDQVLAGEALPNIELVAQLDGLEPAYAPVERLCPELGYVAAEFVFDWPGVVPWRSLSKGAPA